MNRMKLSILIVSVFIISGCASVQMTPKQVEEIRSAVARVLPREANVEVTQKSHFLAKPSLIVSAHLLEGHSPDETNPYVRGDYSTQEKLTRLVRYRSAKIIKSVVSSAQIPDVSKIVIQARHGVSQFYYGIPFGGNDVAMTIYVVSISIKDLRDRDYSKIDEKEIMLMWKVNRDIIPSLHFQSVWF